MRRISMIGVCIAAVLALTAAIAGSAQAAAPEYGQCIKLTKYTTPKEKHGKYEDATCLTFSHKLKKGEPVAQEKGNYEWRSGAPLSCEKLAKPKGKYEDAACTKLHVKIKKGVEIPDGKGNYEKVENFDNGPGFEVKKQAPGGELQTAALGGPIECATKSTVGKGTITGPKTISVTVLFETCETSGKKCTNKAGAIKGDIETNPLVGSLYVPSLGFVGTDFQAAAGKEEMSSEIECEGQFARTHDDVGGHITSPVNVMTTSGTEKLGNDAQSKQSLLTEASLTGFGGPWAPVGGAKSLELTESVTTYDSAVEVRTKEPEL